MNADNIMLREKLQAITQVSDVASHPSLLSQLSEAHSIKLISSSAPLARYTCLMHVLELVEHPEYVAIAGYGFGFVYAGPEFAHWLISKNHLISIPEAEAQPGDLVFYFDDDMFRHAGILVEEGRVRSKWGIGHLYEHALHEVPSSYGNHLRFYRPLDQSRAVNLFRLFADEHGIPPTGHLLTEAAPDAGYWSGS